MYVRNGRLVFERIRRGGRYYKETELDYLPAPIWWSLSFRVEYTPSYLDWDTIPTILVYTYSDYGTAWHDYRNDPDPDKAWSLAEYVRTRPTSVQAARVLDEDGFVCPMRVVVHPNGYVVARNHLWVRPQTESFA